MRPAWSPGPAVADPDTATFTDSLYVPARTYTVSPSSTEFAACWMVRQGDVIVPALESLPLVET